MPTRHQACAEAKGIANKAKAAMKMTRLKLIVSSSLSFPKSATPFLMTPSGHRCSAF
jgi:hypothetical protein